MKLDGGKDIGNEGNGHEVTAHPDFGDRMPGTRDRVAKVEPVAFTQPDATAPAWDFSAVRDAKLELKAPDELGIQNLNNAMKTAFNQYGDKASYDTSFAKGLGQATADTSADFSGVYKGINGPQFSRADQLVTAGKSLDRMLKSANT